MRRQILALTTLCLLAALSLWAQDTATIVGTVTDPTGAVVPGAKVTVSNPDKGYTRNLVSDSAGAYTAAKVPIGEYVVTAEAPGFQGLVRNGISLGVGQTLRLDLSLTVGQAMQQITVSGQVAKVETETGGISDVVTGSQVVNLELNARNFTNLALLVPGAAPGTYDPTTIGVLGGVTISFNGNRAEYNNWEIDGANNTDEGAGGTANTGYPNIDSIAEFRISTSNYSAEYGKHAGATIEVATKAGTRQFHGDLFEFLRNDHLDANDWFVNRQIAPPGGHAPKRPLKRHDYGFTLGGPLFIPGRYNTQKNKTFFFWSEEWRKNREGTIIDAGVPSLRMRQGDFSECDKASSNYNPVVASGCLLPTDPTTGQVFTNDAVPVAPDAKALLDGLIPLPNNGAVHYTAAHSLPTDWRQDQIRVDHNIGDKTSLFVRYTQEAYNQDFVPTLWNWANYDTVKTKWAAPVKTAVLHLTHTFKPNLMNEFIMGFSADVNLINNVAGPSSPAKSISKPSDFTAKNLFAGNAKETLLPGVAICGGVPFCVGEATGYKYFYWGPITTWKDNVVWTAGAHTLKFGFFIQAINFNSTNNGGASTQGFFSFSNSAANSTGNALADMFLGRIQQYTEYGRFINGQPVGNYAEGHWNQLDLEPYIQDDWKVTRKLSLNLGVRYYLIGPLHDQSGLNLDSTFFPNLYSAAREAQLDGSGNLIPGTGQNYLTYGNGLVECGKGGVHEGCFIPNRGTIAPRFGFAWDPWGSGKTAVRGGYGIFFDTSNGNAAAAGLFGNPPVVVIPSVFNVTGYENIQPGALSPTATTMLPYHEKWPSVQQFSLGVQHEFPGNNLLSVSYVGSLGRHLSRSRNMNQVPLGAGIENVPSLANANQYCDAAGNCDVQNVLINDLEPTIFFGPFRGYGFMQVREHTSVSSYNSLQMSFRHTIGHGLVFQSSYTWAHGIDDTSGQFSPSGLGVDDYHLSRWRATSSLCQTHVLVMNYIYSLPFFKGSSNPFLKTALGGWQISGITSFFTGQPIDIGCGIAGLSSGVGGAVRCNSLGPVKVKKGEFNDPQFGPTPTWFDPNTIGQITVEQLRADGQPGMFGYMGRNPLRGPGRNNWDLALLKDFAAPWFRGEHSTFQFRWETFNTFNHPQWQGVNAFCSGQTPPGQPCSGVENNLGNGEVSSAWPARIMQFGVKFIF